MKKKAWSRRRWNEFVKLKKLIYECQSLNRANNVVQRIQRIEKMAEMFDRPRLANPRRSFLGFLEDIAAGGPGEYEPEKTEPAK